MLAKCYLSLQTVCIFKTNGSTDAFLTMSQCGPVELCNSVVSSVCAHIDRGIDTLQDLSTTAAMSSVIFPSTTVGSLYPSCSSPQMTMTTTHREKINTETSVVE